MKGAGGIIVLLLFLCLKSGFVEDADCHCLLGQEEAVALIL